MPWLQLPAITQSILSATGQGPQSPEALDEAKRQLPMWAQRSETVVGTSGAGRTIGGGTSGALAGGVAGGRLGGARGALAGAAIGGLGGAGLANMVSDAEDGDRLRGIVLDWLPHTSFFLTSTSPEFGGENLPFKDLQGLIEQAPAEPLAIFKPIMDALHGRTAWGQEIQGEDVGDQFGKAFAGILGFLAPPFIQKYGLKTTTPDISYTEWLTGEPVSGDITNMSRALIDTGAAIDPTTGRPGSFTNDFFLKNFSIWKSWAADPAVKLANETGTEKHLRDVRNLLSKNLSFYLENGNDGRATDILTNVMSTFSRQYPGDPKLAQEKYSEWLERRISSIGRHPRLRTF